MDDAVGNDGHDQATYAGFGSYVRDVLGYGECTDDEAYRVVALRNCLASVSDWDSTTGQALPTSIDRVANALQREEQSVRGGYADRLLRAALFAQQSFRDITRSLHSNILRDHKVLPIRSAREFDSESMLWLSRKPGATIREKLCEKQSILAVHRIRNYNTVENRLLKEYAILLVRLLRGRRDIFGEESDLQHIISECSAWLATDDALSIQRQAFIVPNNTLLHDKNYRKVWRSWQSLHSIADDTKRDIQNIDKIAASILCMTVVSRLMQMGSGVVQMPVVNDWDNMSLKLPFAMPIMGRFTNGLQWEIALRYEGEGFAIRLDGKSCHIMVENGEIIMCGKQLPQMSKENVSTLSIHNIFDGTAQAIVRQCFARDGKGKKTVRRVSERSVHIDKIEGTAAVDLCEVRPRWCAENSVHQASLQSILMEQIWSRSSTSDDALAADCEDATAVLLHCDAVKIHSITMKDAFIFPHDNDIKMAVMHFARVLKDALPCDSLCYVVPDWVNSFAVSTVSSAINSECVNAAPLPKSIAAVTKWSTTDSFRKSRCRNGDIVLVADIAQAGDKVKMAITPIAVSVDNTLSKKVPDTKGICWERYPTFYVSEHKMNMDEIDKDKCKALPVVCDGKWFAQCTQGGDASPSSTMPLNLNAIENALRNLRISTSQKVYILPLLMAIEVMGTGKKNWSVLQLCTDIALGAAVLCKRQKAAGVTACWKDHLPNLSIEGVMNGRYSVVYLVKDYAEVSMQSKRLDLKSPGTFTLPSGKEHLKFPLWQGEGREAMEWAAEIKHPSFPLEHDVVCDMKMTYTYGSDSPYELRLVPKTDAPFKSLSVAWTSNDTEAEVFVPPFAEKKTWDKLRHWQDKKGERDLIDRCIKAFNDISKVVSGKVSYCGTGKGGQYWKLDSPAGKIYCPANKFVSKTETQGIGVGHRLYFVADREGRRVDRYGNIQYASRYVSQDYYRSLHKALCACDFPVVKIWGDCRSLQDSEAPDELRVATLSAQKTMIETYSAVDVPDDVKNEIEKLCATMHKDCLAQFTTEINKPIHIGRAIGDCALPWQKEMFDAALASLVKEVKEQGKAVRILAIAMWRSEDLVFRLTADDTKNIIRVIHSSTSYAKQKIAESISNTNAGENYQRFMPLLIACVELYLAILRLRVDGDDSERKQYVMPATDRAMKYVHLLDDICEVLSSDALKDYKLKSFIDVKVQKDKSLYATPDLICALRQFLTGDKDGARISIQINQDED